MWAERDPRAARALGRRPTAVNDLGSRLTPGVIGDRYLARTGFDSQQTPDRVDEHRRRTDYLFSPVRGDHGAHGPFADESKARSAQVWLAEHRGVVAAGAGAAVAGALAAAGAAATRR